MSTTLSESSVESMPYATPAASPRGRAWASVAILFGGLCLIGLGGCFLIGVLILLTPAVAFGAPMPLAPLTGPQSALLVVLYALAAACFVGAVVMLVVGARSLL